MPSATTPSGTPDRASDAAIGRADPGAAPEMVQLLTPEGERVEHPDFAFTGDADLLRRMLRDMVIARRFDKEATSLQRQGELGMWPPLLGQEASQVGAAWASEPTDMVFPTYREHAIALHRNVPPGALLALFRGTSMGDWDVEDARFASYQIIIGAQTLHATGYAMGVQHDGMVGNPAADGVPGAKQQAEGPTGQPTHNEAVLAFHGDGASSQGDVNEAYVFAASFQAPVVFFCTNNQWAISEPSTRQSRIPLYQRAWGYGFPGVRVDGNDALAVYAVTQWALRRAREGQGPSFIEAFTYRMGAHTTSDDPTKYRLDDETETWRRRDPIERLRSHLLREGIIDEQWLADLDAEAERFGVGVRQACRELESEPLSHRFDTLHRLSTAHTEQQREELLDYLEGFDDDQADAAAGADQTGGSTR